jgi:hypothetical protein
MFCSYLITFTQLAEQTGSRSTNDLCSIICGFARSPLAASATTYISVLLYSTPGDSIRNIEAPARAVNQTRRLRPDMIFFFEQYFQPAVLSSMRRCGSMGFVLRRLKSVTRQRAVVLMAQNLEGVEDASAWIVVFACEVRMLRSSSCLF